MSETAEGFLGRWSRRKAARIEEAPPPTSTPTPAVEPGASVAGSGSAPVAEGIQDRDVVPAAEAVELPTLADVAALTHSSDYSRFVLPGVEADVRNAAMRKLFSDPRFNVMDGLDTYIEDYNSFVPMDAAMVAALNHGKALLDPLAQMLRPAAVLTQREPERAGDDATPQGVPAAAGSDAETAPRAEPLAASEAASGAGDTPRAEPGPTPAPLPDLPLSGPHDQSLPRL